MSAVTVQLRCPLTSADLADKGKPVTELQLPRPTLKVLQRVDTIEGEVAMTLATLELLTGRDKATLRQLKGRDLEACAAVLAPLLREAAPEGDATEDEEGVTTVKLQHPITVLDGEDKGTTLDTLVLQQPDLGQLELLDGVKSKARRVCVLLSKLTGYSQRTLGELDVVDVKVFSRILGIALGKDPTTGGT
jgi:hypothetical protein